MCLQPTGVADEDEEGMELKIDETPTKEASPAAKKTKGWFEHPLSYLYPQKFNVPFTVLYIYCNYYEKSSVVYFISCIDQSQEITTERKKRQRNEEKARKE